MVARDDARVAKRMFVFLGLPGALLAAILTSYAGGVLASALRREQAILRIRGANRRDLLRMHALRTLILAASGRCSGSVWGWFRPSPCCPPTTWPAPRRPACSVGRALGAGAGFVATGVGAVRRRPARSAGRSARNGPSWPLGRRSGGGCGWTS